MTSGPSEFVSTVCPHDCPSVCALEVERLDARRIGKLRGAGDASAAPVMACEPPPDHVTNADDCDDDNPSAHAPSDPEICDSRDNDCDDAVPGDEGL